MNNLTRQVLTVSCYLMNWAWAENTEKVQHHRAPTVAALAPTCRHHSSDRECLSETLERQYSTKRRARLSGADHEAEACHLVEGAESRIGLVKMRSDRILICLSRSCRHTDVKGKRRGVWWGGSGYQAFTSDRETEKKRKKRFISWLLRLNFCATFFICFTIKDPYFLKVNKKCTRLFGQVNGQCYLKYLLMLLINILCPVIAKHR